MMGCLNHAWVSSSILLDFQSLVVSLHVVASSMSAGAAKMLVSMGCKGRGSCMKLPPAQFNLTGWAKHR